MHGHWTRFISDERGATSIEYALIAGLVSILLISGASAIGLKMADRYGAVADRLP
ncbi:MAG: Flp/Fap pilin component [Hyphomicrobiales bacterium]|nr:Flp/Fap pilin component [Hyphomicrobiales bacterium]